MKTFIIGLGLLFTSALAHGQGLSANYLFLKPGSLPTICRQGEVRINGSGVFEVCGTTNTWGAIPTTPVGVAGGGTGATTLTTHGVLIGEGTSPVVAVSPSATVGALFTSAGASADPVYSAAKASSAGTVTIPTGQQLLGPDGTLSLPAVAFANEANTGYSRAAATDLVLGVGGAQAVEYYKVGSNVNLGFGPAGTVSTSATNPFTLASSLNGGQFWSIGNTNTGTSSYTSVQLLNGTPSPTVSLGLENHAYQTSGYLAGADVIYAGASVGPQFNIANEWGTNPNITFNLGSSTLASANEYMVLNTTGLNLKNGAGNLNLSGSSSGTVSINTQAAAGTYNFNLPTTAGTANQVLASQGGGSNAMTWVTSGTILPGVQAYNFLVDSAFDDWQAGTSTTITDTGGASPNAVYAYQADQWYAGNTLGGGSVEGIITYSQVAGVTNGSKFGASVKITTAPTGTGIQNGTLLYQPLSNAASLPLYGQTASFTILIKALGNVNQVGCTFMYATSEGKLSNTIGSEVTATVNSSTFSACTINGQALGTSQTTSGIIGVRVRVTGVSSGNTYDLNNGFVAEQAMLNLGSTAAAFSRQFNDPVQELAACRYFYQPVGVGLSGAAESTTLVSATVTFNPPMRVAPTLTPISGTYTMRYPLSPVDKASSNPPVLTNVSASTTGVWMNIGTFSGLTAGNVVLDRGNGSVAFADARM